MELTESDKVLLKTLEHVLPMDGTQVLYVNGKSAHGVVVLFPSKDRSIYDGLREIEEHLSSVVNQMGHIVADAQASGVL